MIKFRKKIENLINDCGCEFFGIVNLDDELSFSAYEKWLQEKKHGTMSYLERYLETRKHPSKLLDQSKSAIVFGLNYYLGDRYQSSQFKTRIAQYARLRDYHKTLKKKGLEIVESLRSLQDLSAFNYRVVVDSAPLLEKALASRTCQGFVGKNTLFIHPNKGSYFLLGEIIVDVELEYDHKQQVDPAIRTKEGGCGSCRRCQVFCPTGALDKDYQLDATRCISYHTIENRDVIPVRYWDYLKLYIFGCDICQLVCPYNRKAEKINEDQIYLKTKPSLEQIALMSQAEYEAWFGGTPLTRAKLSGLKRNALIAMVVTQYNDFLKIKPILDQDHTPVIQKTLRQIPEYRLHKGSKKKKDIF